MAITTSYSAIRDNYIALIEAATPAVLPGYKFRRSPRDKRLRDFALSTGSASLRGFEIMRTAVAVAEPEVQDPSAVDRTEVCEITIAYPVVPALYGRTDFDEIEVVMRRDARQIRDLLFSSSAYVAGQSAGFPTIAAADRTSDQVWFQEISVVLLYLESQTLT